MGRGTYVPSQDEYGHAVSVGFGKASTHVPAPAAIRVLRERTAELQHEPVDDSVEMHAVVETGVAQINEVTRGNRELVHEDLRGEGTLFDFLRMDFGWMTVSDAYWTSSRTGPPRTRGAASRLGMSAGFRIYNCVQIKETF
jgi:hypothetical protein